MAIDSIIESLAAVYRAHFNRQAGDLHIKRVTENVPEAVTAWPWLFFVVESGEVAVKTFARDLPGTPRRRRAVAFGSTPADVRRPKIDLLHRFKLQLVVCPRRDLAIDETRVRIFIEPLITVAVENLDQGGAVQYCRPTSYRYGVLTLGQVSGQAVDFAGVELSFEAQEVV